MQSGLYCGVKGVKTTGRYATFCTVVAGSRDCRVKRSGFLVEVFGKKSKLFKIWYYYRVVCIGNKYDLHAISTAYFYNLHEVSGMKLKLKSWCSRSNKS